MKNQFLVKKIILGLLILLVSVGTVFGFRYVKQTQKTKDAVAVVSMGKVKGPDSAPIRILDFSDFQCPACGVAVQILDTLMEKYPGKIQLVYKHFPLRMHVWSGVAHQAAECASIQGQFWDYYHKLYKNQASWAPLPDPMVSFATYAKEVGLDMDGFTNCMVDPAVAENVMAEKKEGEVLEVKSTPTFFINGKMFAGPAELMTGGEELIRKTLGLPAEPKPIAPASNVPQPAEKPAA